MVVDEDNLVSTMSQIREEINITSRKVQTLRELYGNISSIGLVTVSDANPDEPQKTKQVLPMDPKLGTTIDNTRREEIYDKVVADFTSIREVDTSEDTETDTSTPEPSVATEQE